MLLDSIVKVTTLLCGSWHGFENALQVFFGPVQYWWLPSIHCQHLACQCLHAFWDCYRALLRPGKTPILQWPTSFYISHMMPDDGWIDELLLHLKDMLLFSFFFVAWQWSPFFLSLQWTFLVVMLPIFYFFLILQVYFFKICVIDKLPFL